MFSCSPLCGKDFDFFKLCMKTEKKPYQCFFFHFKKNSLLYQVLICILIVNYIYIGFVVYIFFPV